MANSSPDPELQRRIEETDAITPSPSARAERVWRLLQVHDPDLTTWDVLCFCAEFIALTAQRYQWILPIARRFVGLVYSAHYYDEHRTDSEADRITRRAEPVDTGAQPNAGPKSLFDLSRSYAESDRAGRGDSSVESGLHIRHLEGESRKEERKEDAGESIGGNADQSAG